MFAPAIEVAMQLSSAVPPSHASGVVLVRRSGEQEFWKFFCPEPTKRSSPVLSKETLAKLWQLPATLPLPERIHSPLLVTDPPTPRTRLVATVTSPSLTSAVRTSPFRCLNRVAR